MSKTLSLILQPCSIGFIILALIMDKWYCGQLLTSCLQNYQSVTLMLMLCLSIGLAFLFVAFSLDLVTVCSRSLEINPTYATIRLVMLLVGIVGIFSGLTVYAVKLDQNYSQLICIIGIVLAGQVSLLNFFLYPCFNVYQQRIIVK
ncbi:unnamed protein product [Schistosoma turkestanicum]|nr:unnamed protein product [Schistosoma turkestanicum]